MRQLVRRRVCDQRRVNIKGPWDEGRISFPDGSKVIHYDRELPSSRGSFKISLYWEDVYTPHTGRPKCINVIPAQMNNHMLSKMCDEINCTAEV